MTINYLVGYLPQYLFICDDNKNILVDDVINIKDINEFFYKKFNIDVSKKNIHKNSNDIYLNYLTDENIKNIKAIYKDDYETFKDYL
tara:strand:+ start:423 stop:683 length:261 start_codon:yes stop_codon:yes gene_type:complete